MNRLFYHARLAAACSLNSPLFLPKEVQLMLVNLFLTENCNSRCLTCDFWRSKHNDRIGTKRAVDLLQELISLGVRNIRLAGGEPLLRPDLFDILNTAKIGDFHKVVLATNGLLLDRYSEEINDSIITNITVSLDGIGDNNDVVRGIKGYYDTVMNGLNKIINKKVKIISTITNILANDIEDLILFCRGKNYEYGVNLPDNQMPYFSSREVADAIRLLWPSIEDIYKIIGALYKYNIASPAILDSYKSYLLNNCRIDIKHCMLGYFMVNILSNGDVETGCSYVKPIGNILSNSLNDIITKRDFMGYVKKMFDIDCKKCSCGMEISLAYHTPIRNIPYIIKRLVT